MMKVLSAVIVASMLLLLFASAGKIDAQSPTSSPTPTATNTLTNQQIIGNATIVPPYICGNVYVPCGALPYQPPRFPTIVLPSPTIVDYAGMPIPLESLTPTPTSTGATSTPSATIDVANLGTMSSSVGSVSSTLMVQLTQQVEIHGTPSSFGTLASDIGSNAGAVYATFKSYQGTFINMWGIIPFTLLMLGFVLVVLIITTVIPLIMGIVRFVLQIFEAFTP